MGDDRIERRAILGAGVGLLASLTGCSGLFIEPEATGTPGDGGSGGEGTTATATPTPTAAPTATPDPTATATATPAPPPSEHLDVRNRQLAIRRSELEKYALVSYRFDIENTGSRTISDAEFRVRIRYEHEAFSRLVAVDYPRFWFDTADDDEDGLDPDETETVLGQVRFERDGRAQESTVIDRFDIDLSIRRIRYV